MWSVNQVPAQLQRSSSVQSFVSDRSSNASEDFESFLPRGPGMWTAPPPAPAREAQQSPVARLSQKFGNVATISVLPLPSPSPSRQQSRSREDLPEDDTQSRSSTLGGDETDYEYPEKTPTPDSVAMKLIDFDPVDETALTKEDNHLIIEEVGPEDESEQESEAKPPQPTHTPGPLELQMQALMAKIIFIEQENATVSITPSEYEELRSRVQTLEAEKESWQARHEALFALRDEDVANTIKLRGILARTRRDLEGMTKLRDDDLENLQAVRGKLAEAIRKLERLETAPSGNGGGSGRGTPTSTRGRPSSLLLERRDTTDLFAAAKAAALEQRTLELEKRNEDLLAQVEELKASAPAAQGLDEPKEDAGIDEINRVAAHKAWKETVSDLNAKLKAKDDELARLRASSVTAPSTAAQAPLVPAPAVSGSYDWHRMEALHEEHASYRERVGGKMQRLRAEKEELQRALHQREDECHVLEAKVQSLQRRVAIA